MNPIRMILICVEYDDLLSLTLPNNLQHLRKDLGDDCMVVTAPHDKRTQDLCGQLNVNVYQTDAFYRNGAKFNKGLAFEEAFDVYGRHGWMLILDADIILPKSLDYLRNCRSGNIYGTYRRILNRPERWHRLFDIRTIRRERDNEIAGYFQYFCCEDPVLKTRPWYDVTFAHAGGADSYFQSLWPKHCRFKLNEDVIHLGPRDKNWYGRASQRLDGLALPEAEERAKMLEQLQRHNGWSGFKKDTSITFLNRIGTSNFKWGGDPDGTDTGNSNHPIQEQT